MKQIQQFRYFGDKHPDNYPTNLTVNMLKSGTLFDTYLPVTQLGVQAPPGTKFYLNDNASDVKNAIIIGYSGLFELNLEGIAEIYKIAFEGASINNISKIPGGHLIIDIIYGEV